MADGSVREIESIEPQLVGVSNSAGSVEMPGLRMRSLSDRSNQDQEEDDEYASESVTQEMPTPEEQTWSLVLVIGSVADVICSLAVFIVAFRFASRGSGVSLYSLAIQSMSHWFSSVLLALRFSAELKLPGASSGNEGLLRRRRRRFLYREQAVSIIMGIVMLLSAAGLLFKAIQKLKFWDHWYDDHEDMDSGNQWATEFLAWYGFSFYVVQAVLRFVTGRRLRRSAVWHGFVISVVSLLFLLVLALAASFEKEWSWKAEPIAAILLTFVTLAEAVRIIILHLDDMDTRLRFDPRA